MGADIVAVVNAYEHGITDISDVDVVVFTDNAVPDSMFNGRKTATVEWVKQCLVSPSDTVSDRRVNAGRSSETTSFARAKPQADSRLIHFAALTDNGYVSAATDIQQKSMIIDNNNTTMSSSLRHYFLKLRVSPMSITVNASSGIFTILRASARRLGGSSIGSGKDQNALLSVNLTHFAKPVTVPEVRRQAP